MIKKLLFIFSLFIFVSSVSADELILYQTGHAFGTQTNYSDMNVCDGSTTSVANGADYDSYSQDHISLSVGDITDWKICAMGSGNVKYGPDTNNLTTTNMTPSTEYCVSTVSDWADMIDWTNADSQYGVLAGGAVSGSSIDCLYSKITYTSASPTPTSTPASPSLGWAVFQPMSSTLNSPDNIGPYSNLYYQDSLGYGDSGYLLFAQNNLEIPSDNFLIDDMYVRITGYSTGNYRTVVASVSCEDQVSGSLSYSGSHAFANSTDITTVEAHLTGNLVCNTGYLHLQIGINNDTGFGTSFIDYIQYKANFAPVGSEAESFILDSSSASASAGLVTMSAHGSFNITPAGNIKCEQQIFEHCEADEKAGWTSNTPVSHISYDATDPQSSTVLVTPLYYLGESDLATSSAWAFNNITVPYNEGFSCDYPMSYYCGHLDNGNLVIDVQSQGISANMPNYNPALKISPESTIEQPPVDCGTDVFCSIREGLKSLFLYLFVPSKTFNQLAYSELTTAFNSRAPFAYVAGITSLNTTDPTTSSAVPLISLKTVIGTENITTSQDSSISTITNNTFGLIRTALKFLIYGFILVYIINFFKRITSKL